MRFKRSKHNLSHYVNLTGDMGKLYPVNCMEVLPGDGMRGQTSTLIRVSPLNAPVMHNVEVRLHHWFVPNRLLWDSWEDFITGGPDGNDASVIPTVAYSATPANEPLLDYLGIKPVANLAGINALPVRAFNMIYNNFYRDQDLGTELTEDQLDIPNIAWEKDYFTAARPWTQKGTEVTLPLGTTAPVQTDGTNFKLTQGTDSLVPFMTNGVQSMAWNTNPTATGATQFGSGLEVDLSAASAASINDLRLAFATQNYQELRARYGSNYVDYLSYLGITPADSRLQRPEYLGGGKQMISFSEILATSPESASNTELGEYAGHGIAAMRSNQFTRFFQEHGWMLTLMSVRPKAIYNDGLNRKFSRTEKEDYYQRELETIGQQEILNKEIYVNHTTPDGIFGYADRYAEYRHEPSRVAGNFRVGENLDHWTLARGFSSDPALNETFIKCEPSKRVHKDTSGPTIWAMCNNKLVARRLVRKNATPAIL